MSNALFFLAPIPVFPTPRSKTSPHSHISGLKASLVLGLNQYTHDASVAIIHSSSGKLLFAQSKERITRQKNDAGDLSVLIRHALQTVGATPQDVSLVVANNHHFRIAPFERRLPFAVSLRYQPQSYLSPFNLIGTAASNLKTSSTKVEVSHHLAHAYSAVYAAPFDRGVVLIMDGMGDALDDWLVAGVPETPGRATPTLRDPNYYTEETLCPCADQFRQFPSDLHTRPGVSFREAETAYRFNRQAGKIEFTRLYKRWTPETAPPELPNHSFEEMESVGAMYSRISAILFKDWNACGKVMGLAPYARSRSEQSKETSSRYFIQGNLFDGTLSVHDGQLKGFEHIRKSMSNCDDSEEGTALRLHFENLAHGIQSDLEDIVMSFVSDLIHATGEQNLVFAGGVALNSSVNGKLSEHPKVQHFYVPPFPGDEGVSIGCALFGYSNLSASDQSPYRLPTSFMPYLGKAYSEAEVMGAIECFSPWITWRTCNSAVETAEALSQSKVVAWFNGRGEFGPRALGSRSILADPRNRFVVDHVNHVVKKRESFRPFAPTVLSENAPNWFDECSKDSSPYMSLTKRAVKPETIPAVVHVDGTSRLQTLSREHNPPYYDMISHFYQLTGVPMVMNTSFNIAGEPIVESPQDALRCFLDADGIDCLSISGIIVEKDGFSPVSDDELVSTACTTFRSEQVQDCLSNSLRTTVVYTPSRGNLYDAVGDEVCEHKVDLIDGLQLSILEIIHGSHSCTIRSILCQLHTLSKDDINSENLEPGHWEEDEAPDEDDIRERIRDLFNRRLVIRGK